LKAGNNGFESDTILISLSSCPRLAEVDLSYNYLQRIPKEVIEEGCFTCLQALNLSYNYIADEEELLPAVLIERLTRLLVYGNPLCGPTGEDESGECVDRVVDASIEARDGWGDHELTIVTVTGKGGGGGASKKKVGQNGAAGTIAAMGVDVGEGVGEGVGNLAWDKGLEWKGSSSRG
jgi:hypothetical protein